MDTSTMRHLILLLVSIGAAVGPLLYLWQKTRRGRRAQEALLRQHAEQLKHGAWFRVRHASKSWFESLLKLALWDAAGILLVGEDAVTFYRYDASGQPEALVFTPDNARAEWVNTRFWSNGMLKWFKLDQYGQQHYFTSDTGMTASNSDTTTRDIYRRTQMTLTGTVSEEALFPPPDFALDKNPHTIAALVVLFGAIAYGLGDFFVNTETYAEAPLYLVYGGGGLFAALATLTWLRGAGIPRPESLGLSVMVGLAIGFALYPGLLRINQLTDARGLQTYAYHLQDDLTLTPSNPALPELSFPSTREYWESLEPGSVHALRLRQGSLGFYQIDMAPLYQKTRQFYAELDAL
jgi:hypothetical protein